VSLPSSPVDQIALLMSGAGQSRDPATRAMYLAGARGILAQFRTRLSELDIVLTEMERNAAAGTPRDQQELAVK
jgi:hypothetical protein